MHQEYAVEPAAIGSSWETFRYLIEKFGFQEGRLISRFPAKWERWVIEAVKAADVGDIGRSRIIEKLQKKKRTAIIKSGREYDPGLGSWIANARASHSGNPFHAIIARDDHDEDEIVDLQGLEDEHPLMIAPISRDVPRTRRDLTNACLPLLRSASEVDIVDPFFDLQDRKYTDLLSLLLPSVYDSGNKNISIRIHFRAPKDSPKKQFVLQNARKLVHGWIPENFELHLYEWQEKPGGEDFHDRFVLCDCGGLMIGAGLSVTGAQENTTITLLDNKHVQKLRVKFTAGATVYDLIGSAVRIKSNGETELILSHI